MTKPVKLLLVFLFFSAIIPILGALSQVDVPFLSSTKLSSDFTLVGRVIQLDVTIGSPLNRSTYVNVTILAPDIECFPTNNTMMMLIPMLSNGSASTKTTSFLLTPRTAKIVQIDVQLWWNSTEIDSKVFVLDVYSVPDPSTWGFWIRINMLVWGLVILIFTTQFLNPEWKLRLYDKETKNLKEYSKAIPFLAILGILVAAACFVSPNVIVFFSLENFLVRLQGKIEPLLAACWILGVLSIGLFTFRKYQWSMSFSRLLLIMLLLLFVFDWLTIPTPPFFGWETFAIVFFSVIVNVLLEMGIRGLIEKILKRGRKVQ
jgi:hypothetical protein